MRMAFNPACEISFLKKNEQEMLYESMMDMQATPSLAQAQQLKQRSKDGKLDESSPFCRNIVFLFPKSFHRSVSPILTLPCH